MSKYRVELEFTEPILGAISLNKEVYRDYILSKHPELLENPAAGEDELLTIEERMEKGMTGFHVMADGDPAVYNYVIKGFLKAACGILRRDTETASHELKAYKTVIDGMVFVFPRLIRLVPSGEMTILERPLRADTAQGPRVALAVSQMLPAGTTMAFSLLIKGKVVTDALIREWFEYGELSGLGQWRSGGYGTFTANLTKTE